MSSRRQRRGGRTALAVACAVSVALAGCTSDPAPAPTAVPAAAAQVAPDVEGTVPEVLAAKGAAAPPLTADSPESYVPTGRLIADSGFRPEPDGFSFPNYGSEIEPVDLRPANVERLFGSQVCASGSGDTCVLTPSAQTWMDTENENMAGGHCMGLSVTALRLYAETLDEDDFGAPRTFDLPLEDNAELQSTLAESFVYQGLHSVLEQQFTGTPTEVVNELVERLEAGQDTYTLGFYKRDGQGGHAVTPLAVEDKGDGQLAILLYDNNYPDTVQAMEIDTDADTYRYTGAVNPGVEPELYDGDATTVPMEIIPTTPGEALQACPFCDDELVESEPGKGTVLGAAERYVELSLTGDIANRPRLLLTTEDGKQTGIVDGRLVEEIPGVEVVSQFADDPSLGVPEPKYRIPFGTSFNVTIDGTDLTATSEDISINLTGDGKVISAEDFSMEPGQVDQLFVAGGKDVTLVYETNAEDGVAPSFFAGVDEADASYTLGATAVGLEKGSLLGFAILQEEGQVLFDTSDAKGVGGQATVLAAVSKLDATAVEQVWLAEDVTIDTGAREDLYLDYKDQPLTPGQPITLEVGAEDGPFRTVQADFQ